jgi:hypothetical protein
MRLGDVEMKTESLPRSERDGRPERLPASSRYRASLLRAMACAQPCTLPRRSLSIADRRRSALH